MLVFYVVTAHDRMTDGTLDKFLSSLDSRYCKVYLGVRGGVKNQVFDPSLVAATLDLPQVVGLSHARNQLLEAFEFNVNDLVCFACDDSWLGRFGLQNLLGAETSDIDLLIGVQDEAGGQDLEVVSQMPLDVKYILKRSSSSAIFARGRALAGFRFDERFGLGAPFGSGEDLDLVLHIFTNGYRGVSNQGVRIGHPKKNKGTLYFAGSILAMSKRLKTRPDFRFYILRRIARGVIFVFTGRLSPKVLLRTVFQALKLAKS